MQRAVLFLLTICICIILTAPVLAAESVRVCRDATSVSTDDDMLITPPAVTKDAKANYDGTLRIHVIEPTSRWEDYDYKKYENAFLSSLLDTAISVPYQGTVNITKVWNGSTFGFGDVTEGNIAVIAAIYEPEGHLAYSHPETNGNPYYAHYVDAAAKATPGHPGSDTTTANSTHTIYIEEASATW
ncbi:MAG: hypothetical protein PHR28_00920 [candidate division Zixibacteria bacterium]|nr:hypothetical protein [candidate division Zixibacteria bacterium]